MVEASLSQIIPAFKGLGAICLNSAVVNRGIRSILKEAIKIGKSNKITISVGENWLFP